MNGWSPATVTLGVDGDVISVAVAEPRFSPYEKHLLIAARRDRDMVRGPHGVPMSEATDPANQFAFESTGATEDYAQSAVNKAAAEHAKLRSKGDTRAFVFGVKRR